VRFSQAFILHPDAAAPSDAAVDDAPPATDAPPVADATPADARVIEDPRFGTIELADNEEYDEQYGAVHAYTEVDGAQVETITSGFGGVGGGHQDGHAQFRIVRDEAGPHYQVNSGIHSYEEHRFGWQDVSPERFEYFRNVNYANEQDPVGQQPHEVLHASALRGAKGPGGVPGKNA
jgi:hypothetical protein